MSKITIGRASTRGLGGAGVAALLAGLALSPANAQPIATAPPAATEADKDARIAALEAELKRFEAELAALKAERAGAAPAVAVPSTAANSTPTTAADARAPGAPSTEAVGAVAQAGPAPRIYGEGVPTTAGVSRIDSGHPVISSTDGRFSANLLGVMQFDMADQFQDKAGPLNTDFRRGGSSSASDTGHARDLADGSNFRRARIGIGGRFYGDFEYSVLFDFGGAGVEDAGHIQELWAQYSGLKPFHFRVGAFPPFIGLEDAGSTNGQLFLERPASADIARSVAGGDYREAVQITANGQRWFVSGAMSGRTVGVVNSSGSGVTTPYANQLGFIGRAAFIPYRSGDALVHLGVHGSYVAHPSDALGPDAATGAVRYPVEFRERPELRVDGTRLIDTGAIDGQHVTTAGLEVAAQKGPVFAQGEYEHFVIDRRDSSLSDPHFSGWYVEGGWMITGESRRYNTGNFAFDGPDVRHNLNPRDGGWGAFELALRYSDTDLNYDAGAPGQAPNADAVRGGDQAIASAGLNWYLNPVARLMLDLQHVKIDRLSPNATAFSTPTGAQIGQKYNVAAVRAQFAF